MNKGIYFDVSLHFAPTRESTTVLYATGLMDALVKTINSMTSVKELTSIEIKDSSDNEYFGWFY